MTKTAGYLAPILGVKSRRSRDVDTLSQLGLGVPWRHRLRVGERREFVMAELRRPGGRDKTRGAELDKQRAVMTARNPKDSKWGECLINVNTKQDPILASRLGRITTEMRRMEFKLQQVKQHFVKTSSCLNHEPLILVERPASPAVRRRAKLIEAYGEDPNTLTLPGYMRPLRSRCRTPSTLTTIDAFTLQTKKKRNVWEEAMDEKEPPVFRSTVRPAARLTRREAAQLQMGWSAHKPRLEGKERDPKDAATPRDPSDTPFVTQLPRRDLAITPDGRLLKSVVLSALGRYPEDVNPVSDRPDSVTSEERVPTPREVVTPIRPPTRSSIQTPTTSRAVTPSPVPRVEATRAVMGYKRKRIQINETPIILT